VSGLGDGVLFLRLAAIREDLFKLCDHISVVRCDISGLG
jgi:hypothetical protein